MKSRLNLLCAVLFLVLGGLLPAGGATPTIRILPLGDSITYGSGAAGGYRGPLYYQLTNAGFNVDFVGTQTGNPTNTCPEIEHEGHGGWRIDQIDSIILGVFGQILDPDVILVLIGTNDYGQGYNTPSATNRLEALIEKMATNRPFAKIIVSSLTVRGEPYNTTIQTNYNVFVPLIVARQRALGREVYYTDLYHVVPLGDMPDQLHPNLGGYMKMATNWFTNIVCQFSPNGSTNAPALARAVGQAGWTNVVVTFSKPVADDAATLTNFSIPGLTILSATLNPTTLRDVTLLTAPQTPSAPYTLVVNGVRDRTTAQAAIAPASSVTFYSSPTRGAYANVSESTNFSLVYSLSIPDAPNYASTGPAYDVDSHTNFGAFSRIAYYLELQAASGEFQYIWVSMDPFTQDSSKIGVPTVASGAIWQQPLTNMNVLSSVAGIVTGTGLSGGNIEFWPMNYNQTNILNVPNATSAAYDWGDQASAGNYGSMQIHNHDASQVLFAFNRWGGTGGTCDLGIGTGSTNPDWTFAQNGSSYTVKTLQVFAIGTADLNPPTITRAVGQQGWASVVVTFSEPLMDDATNAANYSIAGLTVLRADLDLVTKAIVTLTTSPQAQSATYTLTVNNIRDRSTNHNVITPNSTTTFFSAPGRGAFANVAEAANYTMVYSLDIPNASAFNTTNPLYSVDLHPSVSNFTRVAYYLELQQSNGPVSFIWTAMDPFTQNTAKIGVPNQASAAVFQQPVTNLTVLSSVSGIVLGTNLSSGNMEFWYWNYTAANASNVANASATTYDWGDTVSTGTLGYGSMQVHNAGASQVLWAFNNWGGTGGGNIDLGIGNGTGANPDWTFMNNAGTYTVKTLQVFVLPAANTNPPALAKVVGQANLTNVVVTFTKPVADDTSLANFSISGLSVLGATLDPVTKTLVTLSTAPQTPGVLYTLTVSGVSDRTASHLTISAGSMATFVAVPLHGVVNNIPGAKNWTMVYSLDIPNTANYSASGPAYSVDAHFAVTNYSRVAYYMELQPSGGPIQFIWAEMDPFTPDAGKIGVPTVASGAFFQQPVNNLTVLSSVAGIVNGTNMTGGNIEFWPWNYAATNAANVPNASSTTLDWGDQVSLNSGNHGCLQIHNAAASQVLLAFNRWGGASGNTAVGIGNNTGNANPDWTLMDNAPNYTIKTLQVFVLPPADTNAPTLARAAATLDGTHIVVTFSEPVADGAGSLANFSLTGGLTLISAVFSNNLREVILTTSPLDLRSNYTVTVSGVRDRSPGANLIAPGSSIAVSAPPVPPQIVANAPEAAAYRLVYNLNIPAASPGWNANGTAYDIDNRAYIGSFSRVAYYLELATNGGATNWIYVSMDAFTTDVNKIGVPDMTTGARFQQKVTNLNVFTSVSGITTGAITNGNLEFWPYDYGTASTTVVPTGSTSTYDWNDTITYTFGTAGHGSMQVHNYGAGQVLFAYNHWGATNTSALGIGNQPTGNPDWTSADNAASLIHRKLYVLVLPVPDTTGPVLLRAAASSTLTNVVVTFDEPLADSAAAPANFVLNNGATVQAAALRSNLREVSLLTSTLTPGTAYALTVNNVRDRVGAGNLIATNSTAAFTTPAAPVFARVPETTNFVLAAYLAVPSAVPNYNVNGLAYSLDLRGTITQPFKRIAYYLELATTVGGTTNWVYVSTDAFTTNLSRIGVPVLGIGAGFQMKLTNLNIYSSSPDIVTGAGIATGNIEFWPFNYSAPTNSAIPGGSTTLFDCNDTFSTGGQYASMQIHNYSVGSTGQVLFAFNHWGGGQTGFTDLGIGNQPGSTNVDWTFSQSATNWAVRNLYILVQPTNALAPVAPVAVAPGIAAPPASRAASVGSATTFAVSATGTAPLAYQWLCNGAPLAGQNNAWLLLNNLQSTNSGGYSVIVTNSAGSVTSLVATLTVLGANHPPVANDDGAATPMNQPLTLPAAALLANDTDADLDPLSVTSVSATSTNGAAVNFASGNVTYTPRAGFTGLDRFTYTISDGRDGTATANVVLNVVSGILPPYRHIVGAPSGGTYQLRFNGVPGSAVAVKRSANLVDWTPLLTTTVPLHGVIEFQDPAPPAAGAFYRVTPAP